MVAGALSPQESHDACVSMLFYVLREWNFRSPRLDRHMNGDWLFRRHEQLVFYQVVSSVRTSKRVLTLLHKSGLLERRKAHLGEEQNVLHLAPSTPVLKLLEQLNIDLFRHTDTHAKPRVMRYLCDRSVTAGDGPVKHVKLVHIGEWMRTDNTYGSARRVEDLDNAMRQARDKYNKEPDPFVRRKPSANSGTSDGPKTGVASANSGPCALLASATSSTSPFAERPDLAPANKVNGYKANGDTVNGDSGEPEETEEIVTDLFSLEDED